MANSTWLKFRLTETQMKRIALDSRPNWMIGTEYAIHAASVGNIKRAAGRGRILQGEVKLVNGKRVASPEYRTWQMMKNRVLNPDALDFRYYGARGIKITNRWHYFANFLADMGRRPSKLHTLDRKDVNGHYCKQNCQWATRAEQSQNRTDSRFTKQKVTRIRQLYKTGNYRQIDIARMFNTTQAAISQITRNAAWRE